MGTRGNFPGKSFTTFYASDQNSDDENVNDCKQQTVAADRLVIAAADSHLGLWSHCVRFHESAHHRSSACHMTPSGRADERMDAKKAQSE